MTKYSKELDTLLHKDMTRQEFLVTIGLGLASLFGIGRLLTMLFHDRPLTPESPMTYGYGAYSRGNEARANLNRPPSL